MTWTAAWKSTTIWWRMRFVQSVALGPKNRLLAGSHEGAKRAAFVYSLVAIAKLHQVEPWQYFKGILDALPDYPHNKIADLFPQNWAFKKTRD